jgi:hypothetical protein
MLYRQGFGEKNGKGIVCAKKFSKRAIGPRITPRKIECNSR